MNNNKKKSVKESDTTAQVVSDVTGDGYDTRYWLLRAKQNKTTYSGLPKMNTSE